MVFTSVLGRLKREPRAGSLGAWDHVAIVNTAALWLFICHEGQFLVLLSENNQIKCRISKSRILSYLFIYFSC